MTRKSPSKLENLSFGPLLRHFLQTIRSAIEESLNPAGFSLRQAMVLSALNRNPGMTGAEMAQSMLITPQAIGELLQEMEKTGLVKRQARRDNARKRAIFLTPSGRKALSTCCAALHAVEDRMLASLTGRERKSLSRLLVHCIEGLDR
ncbi:MAG TPA: MarR family transcriptional regulator [Rhizomicrobium sp.]|nr:MarR family transcriptional regulator [Rhizomicrobium sp.]